jgi:ATP-dependent Lhr-like helicase
MAGLRAHETLASALPIDFEARGNNESIRVSDRFSVRAVGEAQLAGALPYVSEEAVAGLKFSAALPPDLARATLAERFCDSEGAATLKASNLVTLEDQKGTA